MENHTREDVYREALQNAETELQQIHSQFDEILRRRDYLNHVVEALTPLLDASLSMQTPQPPPTQAPREPQPFAQSDFRPAFESVVEPQAEEPVIQAAAPAPSSPFPATGIFLRQAEESPKAVEQSIEQPAEQHIEQSVEQPAQPAPGNLQQRINYALNFALLS